jgi:DNA-binding response OmpR family regulator
MDKLLIVDDEPDIISLLKLVLEAEGYEVVPALSGDEALRLAEVEAPDLVLLDLMMPGKSGLETCRYLRNQPRTKNTPVIIFSALGRDVDKKLTTEAGASAHLTKPFNNIGLLTEIKRCLGEARGWKFSKQLGIDHSKLSGKKLLLEFEPRTDFERLVRDFAMECAFLGESVVIITRKGSSIRQSLEGDQGIKFVDLERAPELLPILKENSEGPLSMVVDSLTDLALNEASSDSASSNVYQFVQSALKTLDESRITALFLLNPSAHDSKDVASIRGVFSNQLMFEKQGVTVARLG